MFRLLLSTQDDYKDQIEATRPAIAIAAASGELVELADDLSALAEAVSFFTVLMMLVEALVLDDPVGALLPTIGEGPLDEEGLLAASAELGVTKAVAVPDPPVIEK